jgi:hypothetical protein
MVTKEKFMKTTVKHYEKHPFNIFPEMTADEHEDVKLDIQVNGYDGSYPIILYQNKILDGWNRQQICEEIDFTPVYEEFLGDDLGAMDFIWRSNKRRNLTSSQWSAIATEAQPIMDAIHDAGKKEKAEKLLGNQNAKKKQMAESIPPIDLPKKERDESRRTKVKVAKAFNTNVKYLDKAKTLAPKVLEQVKNGELTMSDIMRAERSEAMKAQVEASVSVVEVQVDVKTELSDVEMLKLIRISRIKVQKLEGTLVKTEMESIQGNANQLEKIREIQLNLGKKLTEQNFQSESNENN